MWLGRNVITLDPCRKKKIVSDYSMLYMTWKFFNRLSTPPKQIVSSYNTRCHRFFYSYSTTVVHRDFKAIDGYHVLIRKYFSPWWKSCRSNSNIKNVWLRNSLPQILAAWKVIKSKNCAPITTPIFLESGIFLFRSNDRPRVRWEW